MVRTPELGSPQLVGFLLIRKLGNLYARSSLTPKLKATPYRRHEDIWIM
jgi:hypothetical protein